MSELPILIKQTQHKIRTIDEFCKSSNILKTTSLTKSQLNYKEPFGIDTMVPEQWLVHILFPHALHRLEIEDLAFFKNIKNVSFFIEYYYTDKKEQDILALVRHVKELEDLFEQVISASEQ